ADINARMHQIEVERSYRIVGKLEQTAKGIKNQIVNKLSDMLKKWKSKVILFDGLAFGTLAVLAGIALTMNESWGIVKTFPEELMQGDTTAIAIAAFLAFSIIFIHFSIRRAVANKLLKNLANEIGNDHEVYKQYVQAFNKSTATYRPMLLSGPAGWNDVAEQTIDEIINEANDYIQALNDQFTNPSGNEGGNSQV
ncbi:MAG: dynamin family protein, partial [Nitrosomonas sp.]